MKHLAEVWPSLVADLSHNSREVQVACALRDLLRNLTGSAKIIWRGVVELMLWYTEQKICCIVFIS